MVYIFQATQGLHDFRMGLIFFQFFTVNGNGDRVHAETGICICRVRFDIVDPQSQTANRSNKVMQETAVFEFQMDLKMVGSVLQIPFQSRKSRKAAEQNGKNDQRDGVVARANGETDYGNTPQTGGSCQAFDLTAGA